MMSYYQYLGNCIDTIDVYQYWDATEMAQMIENSESYDIQKILSFLTDYIKLKYQNTPGVFECGIYNDIVWVYDADDDMHYFYQLLLMQ